MPRAKVLATKPPKKIDIVNEHVVTIPEAAKHMCVSVPHMWRLILSGKIASFKLASSRRTSLEAVARYVDSTS